MNRTINCDLDSLRLVFGLATENASRAVCQWTQGALTLNLDDVCEVSIEQAASRLGLTDSTYMMAVLAIDGAYRGDILLMFGDRDARQLCADLTGIPSTCEESWSEIEESAIAETGNILGSAYLNALTNVLGQQLTPSPPTLVHDFGLSVVHQLLMEHSLYTDTIFVSRTSFLRRDGDTIDGDVIVIPSTELKNEMQKAVAH